MYKLKKVQYASILIENKNISTEGVGVTVFMSWHLCIMLEMFIEDGTQTS